MRVAGLLAPPPSPGLVAPVLEAQADGTLLAVVLEPAAVADALGLPALADAPDYLTNADRVANRDRLTETLTAVTRGWRRDDLLAALERAGVPAGPINDMADVFADPQVIARGMRIDPEGIPGVRTPIRFSDADLSLDRASPKLGSSDR